MKGQRALPWLLAGSILWVLPFGQVSLLTLPRAAERADSLPVDGAVTTLLAVFLLVAGISNIVTVRWLFLPQVERKRKGTPAQIGLVSFTFAVAPSVYGVVVVVFTGQGPLTLPFSALSLVGIALIYPYLKRVVAALQ